MTKISNIKGESTLKIKDVHDRAMIFLNGSYMGVIYRNDQSKEIKLNLSKDDNTLDILVEKTLRV